MPTLSALLLVRMTPLETKNGGASLAIQYAFEKSPFGMILIASTPKGIVHLAFSDTEENGLKDLRRRFPKAALTRVTKIKQKNTLHVAGTDFQLKVWQALLSIPSGTLVTYAELAKMIGKPRAVRAVASAVAANTVAVLVPCHRVIPARGGIGKYRWGSPRKAQLISKEAKRLSSKKFS